MIAAGEDVDRHLTIVHTVAESVSRSLDVDEVLRTALDALTHVTGHETSSLHLLSPDGASLHLRGERGLSPELRAVNLELPVGEGLIGQVATHGRTIVIANATEEPAVLSSARCAVRDAGVRGFVCVAIVSRGRVLGTLSLGRHTAEPFSPRDVALLEATAGQIGIALDNARLYSEIREQLEMLRRTQRQLVQAEKLSAVGALASGIAHEVNNPLCIINARAELLLRKGDVAEPTREAIRIVADESKRAAQIVKNLLRFAREDVPDRRPASLGDLVRRVLELTAYDLKRAQVRVETDLGPCAAVWIDENQIQQVLLNLVQNAQQAMARQPGERVLTVTVRDGHHGARVDVLDTGPGIPDDVLPRVFDPFFTTKSEDEGTGLGLSVSYGIVAEHGGRLSAANRPDGGARFTIELPKNVRGPDMAPDTPKARKRPGEAAALLDNAPRK